jgi:hypothetical protein
MATALHLARAVTEATIAGRPLPAAIPAELMALGTNGPVFVTLYGPERAGRTHPEIGRWFPAGGEPPRSLGEALRSAAEDLGRRARTSGTSRVEILKVDVAGPSRRLWLSSPWYLGAALDPGVDGVLGTRNGMRAFRLPAWPIERGGAPADVARELAREVGGQPSLESYRTTSFVEGPPDEPGALPVFRGNVLTREVSPSLLRRSLHDAARYLARSIDADGRYCYSYLVREDRCDEEYNVLRHAGTTYSLYQLYALFGDPDLLDAAERATGWLRAQIRTVDGDPSRAFVLEGDQAKLGGAGLAVLNLVERERTVKDGHDRILLGQLGAQIVGQQRADGYWPSLYAWRPSVPVPQWNSIYYPGEALLALVRLDRLYPDPRYRAAALRGAEFLVERRWKWASLELFVPPDAWLAQALAELDAVAPRAWLRDYAIRIVEVTELTMLRRSEGIAPDLEGGPASGFAFPGVAPAGSRNEATTAVWRMARRRGERAEAERLRNLAMATARFALSQQFRPANSYFLPDPARARGGFRGHAADGAIRIDYVQHNATGLLGLLAILEETP